MYNNKTNWLREPLGYNNDMPQQHVKITVALKTKARRLKNSASLKLTFQD